VLYTHLVLQDYLASRLPEKLVVCPEDKNRLNWQDDPQEKFDNGFWLPFQEQPVGSNKRWPYSSSYNFVPASYDKGQSQNGPFDPSGNSGIPRISQGTSNTYGVPAAAKLGGLSLSAVFQPAQKVHAFDSGARHFGTVQRYYALPESRQPLLFFDGSVNNRITADANRGWDPENPSDECGEFIIYSPRPWEPPAKGGDPSAPGGGQVDITTGWYQWTRLGLAGIDYGGGEPDTGQGKTECDE